MAKVSFVDFTQQHLTEGNFTNDLNRAFNGDGHALSYKERPITRLQPKNQRGGGYGAAEIAGAKKSPSQAPCWVFVVRGPANVLDGLATEFITPKLKGHALLLQNPSEPDAQAINELVFEFRGDRKLRDAIKNEIETYKSLEILRNELI